MEGEWSEIVRGVEWNCKESDGIVRRVMEMEGRVMEMEGRIVGELRIVGDKDMWVGDAIFLGKLQAERNETLPIK